MCVTTALADATLETSELRETFTSRLRVRLSDTLRLSDMRCSNPRLQQSAVQPSPGSSDGPVRQTLSETCDNRPGNTERNVIRKCRLESTSISSSVNPLHQLLSPIHRAYQVYLPVTHSHARSMIARRHVASCTRRVRAGGRVQPAQEDRL